MTNPSSPRPLESSLLRHWGFRHAFFTREGGVSPAPYDSLNFTDVTGDSPEHVRENLRRIAQLLGVAESRIFFLTQVHGTEHVFVTERDEPRVIRAREGDAVIGDSPEIACAIRTADCVSLLLACVETGLVVACHAGWKGCAQNIAAESVRELKQRGAGRIVAAIGPHISRAAFEVSEEVAEELQRTAPHAAIVDRSTERPHVDLRALVHAQLENTGLAPSDIDDVHGCTVLEPESYFSFRRDGEKSGRLLSAIVPRARS